MASKFIWYELLAADADAAAAFYGKVVGWSASDSGTPGYDYRLLGIGGAMVAGLMTLPAEAAAHGMRPGWLGYLHVPNVDSAITAIVALGGKAMMPGTDIPNVGRFAMVADPQGALFYVMTPSGDGESPSFSAEKLGHCGWNELHAEDGHNALAFYGKQFGFGLSEEMDMGPMGKYLLFNAGGDAIGGMMTKHSPAPPHWLFYFSVADITKAIDLVKDAGGQVLNGPHQVPGGMWIIQGQDPQGALFALVSAVKS